jgi:hypothetical protein
VKKITLILSLAICACLPCVAQTVYEPKLLILAPGDQSFDPVLQKEIDTKNAELNNMALQAQEALKNQKAEDIAQPENIRLMQQSSIAFVQHIDVFKQISFLSQQYLTYRFYERFTNCLVLLKDEKSKNNLADLQKLAQEQQMPYILNLPKIAFYKQNGQTWCKLQLQLYDLKTNQLLVDKEYQGNWNNPGFEFSCEQGSIGCTINNAMAAAMPDVLLQIASHNTTLIREKELVEKRTAFIETNIYPQAVDATLIKQVIPVTDKSINLTDLYQCFRNSDNSKFVGFFIKTMDKKDAKSLLEEKEDQHVKVITSKDIHEPGYLDQKPQTYAYIVKGVIYNGKWYYAKSEATYFDAANLKEGKLEYLNNLQQWAFFKDDTTEPGPVFWETKLFEKIADKRKDPNWEKYKDMWATEEKEDRDYIGLYSLVADQLKKEREAEVSTFRDQLSTRYLLPFYNKQAKLKLNHIIKFDFRDFNLIYPKDRHVVINPMSVTDEKGAITIRYFVLLPQTNEIFEWLLVKPTPLNKNDYTDNPITKTINTFTKWDFSYPTLDDSAFWNDKVLLKENGNYKYLKKLQ